MQLKIKVLKFTKYLFMNYVVVIAILTSNLLLSQDNSTIDNNRNKIDGVAAVVGDFLVLDSDIEKQFNQLKASGISTDDMTTCQVFGKLLEDKLYQHHAIQDSISVNSLEIQSFVDQQIDAFAEQIGSMEKLINYYNKNSEQELRNEMFELNKSSELAKKMQEKIIDETEVTPEEVRQFFNSIPKNDRPFFGTELKVAQIVVIPETTEEEKKKVIDRLKEFKADVEDNGANFTTKVVLYSDDLASRRSGGKLTLNRKKQALYFSRSLIPFPRFSQTENSSIWRHLGVYLFQRNFLLQFHQWPESVLEQTEQLEQLRILENGETLLCVEAENDGVGVDVPQDVKYAEVMLKSQKFK